MVCFGVHGYVCAWVSVYLGACVCMHMCVAVDVHMGVNVARYVCVYWYESYKVLQKVDEMKLTEQQETFSVNFNIHCREFLYIYFFRNLHLEFFKALIYVLKILFIF